ncbi:metallophosphoesterase [Thermodesulfobacteriota bacterium]
MKPVFFPIIIGLFLSLYGGINYYVYKKIIIIAPLCRWPTMAGIWILALMPLLVAFLENAGPVKLAVPLAWAGYIWMGLAFLLFSFSIVLDSCSYLVKAGGWLSGSQVSQLMAPWRYYSAVAALVLTLAATAYGFFAARQIHVEWIVIPTSKLGKTSDSFRIVQISDLHLGLLSEKKRLRGLIEVIESVRPDVVVSTGDLMDMQQDHLGEFADLLHELKARFGKFAVTGNHEAFAGLDDALAFTQRAGFTMLSYDGVKVNGTVNIVGVDDPAVSGGIRADSQGERRVLKRYPEQEFTVLLKHQPVVDVQSLQWFDLQLSGHTHGGQIFPFTLLTRLAYPVKTGLSRVGDRSWLYVSRGTGTWGPPIRFLAPPEVTVIELRSGAVEPAS